MEMDKSRSSGLLFYLCILLYGALGIALQVFLLRRLLATLGGNELSVVFGLAIWLLGAGLGSWISGNRSRFHKHNSTLCFLSLSAAFLFPICSLWSPFAVRGLTGHVIGQAYTPSEMLLCSVVLIGLPCFLWGCLFPVLCRIGNAFGVQSSRVFLFEAVGAGIGGLLYTFLFLPSFDEWTIALVLVAASVCQWIAMVWVVPGWRHRGSLSAGILGVALLACLMGSVGQLRNLALDANWQGFDVLEAKDSLYGSLVVTQQESQISFHENGTVLFSYPDEESYEDVIHIPLLQHPNPKTLLLVGGGPAAITEAGQHPLDEIHYVELDSSLVSLIKRYAAGHEQSVLDDPRVTLSRADARREIKNARQRFDVIAVCLGDPTTLQTNRLFTEEFFSEARRCLAPGGILAFEVSSAENVLSDDLVRYLQLIRDTLSSVWEQVLCVPGLHCLFLASDQATGFETDVSRLYERHEQRAIQSQYLFYMHLPVRLDPMRLHAFKSILQTPHPHRINRDLHPLAFYHAMLLWSKQMQQVVSRRLTVLLAHREAFLSSLAVATLLAGLLARTWGNRRIRTVLIVMGFGLCEMGFSVLLILAFSAQLGYVYSRIGLLSTAFMFGTGLGAWIQTRSSSVSSKASSVLIRNCCLFAVMIVLTPLVIKFGETRLSTMLHEIVFYALSFAAGLLGGQVFPLALRSVSGAHGNDAEPQAGLFYGADLVGSALGAFGVSLLLLPLGGIWIVCLGMALVLGICVWVQRV